MLARASYDADKASVEAARAYLALNPWERDTAARHMHGSWPKVARVLGVANGDADASHEVGQGMEDRDMRPRGLDMECG